MSSMAMITHLEFFRPSKRTWLYFQLNRDIRNDINMMGNFKPGEYMRMMFIQSVSDTSGSE